jgi:hypothetical protein
MEYSGGYRAKESIIRTANIESKDRARNLAKRVDRQKDADLNSHQQTHGRHLRVSGRRYQNAAFISLAGARG